MFARFRMCDAMILTFMLSLSCVCERQSVRQWVADAPAHAHRLRDGAQAAVEMSPLPRQGRAAPTAGSRTATPASSASAGGPAQYGQPGKQ